MPSLFVVPPTQASAPAARLRSLLAAPCFTAAGTSSAPEDTSSLAGETCPVVAEASSAVAETSSGTEEVCSAAEETSSMTEETSSAVEKPRKPLPNPRFAPQTHFLPALPPPAPAPGRADLRSASPSRRMPRFRPPEPRRGERGRPRPQPVRFKGARGCGRRRPRSIDTRFMERAGMRRPSRRSTLNFPMKAFWPPH